MKKIILALALALSASACVEPSTAVAYASRAHPKCTGIHSLSHSYSQGKEGSSMTEVQMTCGDETRSITVKCNFGFGIISDTVCHENN